MLDNLQILFQILSAALKVGINSSILQMRKLRLREAKKVAQVHGRKLQNQNLYREQPEGVFMFLYPMLPSHRGKRLTLLTASIQAGDEINAWYTADVQEKMAELDCMENTRGFQILLPSEALCQMLGSPHRHSSSYKCR